MGDCNAHLGSVEISGIGGFHWSEENTAGGHLRTLIESRSMVLPSTFGHLHNGTSDTFRSASGGRSRVDYIGIPFSWLCGVKASYVATDFDLLSGDLDHSVIALELEMSIKPSAGTVRSRRAQYDRHAARSNPALLRTMLDTIPSIPWGVPVDQHWSIIERHCSRFLKRHFPLPKRHVRQAYFSEQTWQILQARKDLSIKIREADRKVDSWRLARIFATWKYYVHSLVKRFLAPVVARLGPSRTELSSFGPVDNWTPGSELNAKKTSGYFEQRVRSISMR